MNETLKETDSNDLLEDDDLEDQEEDSEDDFDFEAWEDYCHEKEIEQASQNHLNWLYNTRGC